MDSKLKSLKIEDYIWLIYIFVSILAIISNMLERRFILNKNIKDFKNYHKINETIFTIAIIIYIYFLYQSFLNKKDKYYYLSLFASTIFLIGGIIFLYVEISQDNEGIIATQ